MPDRVTGGCQCGRVRYTAQVENDAAYLCHCRMCQRATGGFAASFVHVEPGAIRWDSEPDWFASSPVARRPFCSHCGTPLGFKFNAKEGLDLTFGTLDDPYGLAPQDHSGAESLHEAWLDTSALPRHRSDETASVIEQWQSVGREVPQ